MDSEFIKLLSIIAIPTISIIITIVSLFIHLSNKIEKHNDKFDAIKEEITNLKIVVEKQNANFGIVEERNIATTKQLTEKIAATKEQLTTTNSRIDKLEIDFKELVNKLLDLIPKKPIL